MGTDTLIASGIGILSTIIGSWSAWFFARRKYNAESDSIEIDNLHKTLEFYKSITEDNNKKLLYYINLAEENRIEMHRLKNMVSKAIDASCLKNPCKLREPFSDDQIRDIFIDKNSKDEYNT